MEQKTYIDQIYQLVFQFGPKILAALALGVVGLWVVGRLTRSFNTVLQRRKVDDSLRPFLLSLVDVALKVTLLLMVAS
ncbi:MAG: hypothetical protein JNK89_02295, partial [Saprospiraceae bacterium]|nr:hypothetical protein [Saprospiraceae bacterium]